MSSSVHCSFVCCLHVSLVGKVTEGQLISTEVCDLREDKKNPIYGFRQPFNPDLLRILHRTSDVTMACMMYIVICKRVLGPAVNCLFAVCSHSYLRAVGSHFSRSRSSHLTASTRARRKSRCSVARLALTVMLMCAMFRITDLSDHLPTSAWNQSSYHMFYSCASFSVSNARSARQLFWPLSCF